MSTTTTSLIPYLLTDLDVQRFIANGYHVIPASTLSLPAAFHVQILDDINARLDQFGNPGNNLLPAVGNLHRLFEEPRVRGALTSLLGEGYAMHPHRHLHTTVGGFKEQGWHRDTYWGNQKIRHLHPRWVMAMYYPQTVTLEMGPTALAIGSQYFDNPSFVNSSKRDTPSEWHTPPYHFTCSAGDIVLMTYDLWHKGTANRSLVGSRRHMFKFQFHRKFEPRARPDWDFRSAWWTYAPGMQDGKPLEVFLPKLRLLYLDVWRWMCGGAYDVDFSEEAVKIMGRPPDKGTKVLDYVRKLAEGATEADRLETIYVLAFQYETEFAEAEKREFVQRFVKFLTHKDSWVVTSARNMLIAIGDAHVATAILKILEQANDGTFDITQSLALVRCLFILEDIGVYKLTQFGLAELAASATAETLVSEKWTALPDERASHIRQHAAEAVGHLGQCYLPELADAGVSSQGRAFIGKVLWAVREMQDEKVQENAALSLKQLMPLLMGSMTASGRAVQDEDVILDAKALVNDLSKIVDSATNRYLRAHAFEVLATLAVEMGNEAAVKAVRNELLTKSGRHYLMAAKTVERLRNGAGVVSVEEATGARWCPLTTKKSPF
ncbi:hypothetical protein BC938DRAFT_478925 [Jimgerdemannia flammicorona]|uniref:Phytanoyl-CoA dioxygenase n=1 Tax=Jimgerdemannia flammicorona TaxID=994334 RepID=A0A433QM23_9FUNG|nr:hypothetical protein BC938DRAFT_478925 [Jimgerdemannia flammicorona]